MKNFSLLKYKSHIYYDTIKCEVAGTTQVEILEDFSQRTVEEIKAYLNACY